MLGQLINQVKYVRWLDTLVTAGKDAAVVATSAIDCSAFDRILVTLEIGATATEAGKLDLKITECDTSNGTFADLAKMDTVVFAAAGEGKQTCIIDARLSKRFVKIVYQRTVQNSTLDSGIYMLYNPKRTPVAAGDNIREMVVT